MKKKILVFGINGFIGSNLTEAILKKTDWEVYGFDLAQNKIAEFIGHERLHFVNCDVRTNHDLVEDAVKKCDVVLPLVAVATPATYVTNPIYVFELDFESNIPIIRHCLKYKKRLIFPSTCEVYGMCPDREFNEEESILVQGPINKERWIYSCCKQLLDRVIYGYGKHHGLQYTIFRPFNWVGPKQDDPYNLKEGSSRVIPQFISNILQGKNLQLVDGGKQRRSFTYIGDAIDGLLKIIENKDNTADGKIFNLGNSKNNASILELAEKVLALAKKYPKYQDKVNQVKIIVTEAKNYYGSGYQDVENRIPSIKNAREYLGWEPKTTLDEILEITVDFYLGKHE
jgi:nucleoside-diphosphate-sugar epimerase